MKFKKHILALFSVCFLFLASTDTSAQIALQYNDTTLCPGQTLTMCAAFSGQADGLNSDDYFTGIINIGFPFEYFGNSYTTCVVSGNGFLNFNANKALAHSAYTWQSALANGEVNNSILAAMVDMNLATGGKIRYQHFGTPGNRKFIVEWCNIPLYGCSSLKVTTQIILYEGTNVIEIHTTHIDPIVGNCPSASSGSYGLIVQGLRNTTGAVAIYTPGRDPAGNWGITGATNDARRFTPNGTTNFIVDTIQFDAWRIIDSVSSSNLKWYASTNPNAPIATGACATVVTDGNVPYYVVRFNGIAGCLNDTVQLTDTVFIHFGTTFDTTYAEICSGQSYPFFGKLLYSSGRYDTLFSSNAGCDSLITLNLTVNPNPVVSVEGSSSVDICQGSSYTFKLSNPDNTNTYQWTKNGDPIPGETGNQIVLNQSGVYRVIGTTNKGCSAVSKPFTLNVRPTPIAQIDPISPEIMCSFDTLTLKASNDQSFQFRWEPSKAFRTLGGNEGSSATGIFEKPTMVTLTVYNNFGCYASDSVFVNTKPCCEIFVPNAFSPNGDGINDYFKPMLQPSQKIVLFQIFDRMGKLVYDNADPKQGWNGKYPNGKDAPIDTYIYILQYTCADGENYSKKESFNLVK